MTFPVTQPSGGGAGSAIISPIVAAGVSTAACPWVGGISGASIPPMTAADGAGVPRSWLSQRTIAGGSPPPLRNAPVVSPAAKTAPLAAATARAIRARTRATPTGQSCVSIVPSGRA